MIIAIDGPAGSGKSTTAKYVADKLNFVHINTGSMYRAIALKCIQENIDIHSQSRLEHVLSNTKFYFDLDNGSALIMDGVDISSKINLAKVTEAVSRISAIKMVREKLVEYQREMAVGLNVVLEGRDIGTVVFPEADFKFYLVAEIKERAIRRKKDMDLNGEFVTLEELMLDIQERDRMDSNRRYSPLKKAKDALELNTTNLTIDEQVDCIVRIIKKKIK